ncbi:MAG: type II toxin-antitoxin system antitoxin SocA domain-containing protein [Planctomycetota bacterium]
MSHIFSIAKEFMKLSLSGPEKDPLTNLRLQKLLYYAQAWSMVLRERDLFAEELQAWRYGPVVPEVYQAMPDEQGAKPITPELFVDVPDISDEDEKEFLNHLWDAYKGFSALKLSDMTHHEAPWIKAWGGRPIDGNGKDPIDVDLLAEYFSAQDVPGSLAKYCHELRRREEEAERRIAEMPPLNAALLKNVMGTKAAMAIR